MTTRVDFINEIIEDAKNKGILETNHISDGYHTFGELYEHRIDIYITLCRVVSDLKKIIPHNKELPSIWRTQKHSDGEVIEGWFLLGIGTEKGKQITYHLPLRKWASCGFAESIDRAPEFDGHTSKDVLDRLKTL